MSTRLYEELLKKADGALEKLLEEDQQLLAKKKGIKNLDTALLTVSRLYIIYGQIVQQLDMCYFQMVHPQKRDVVRLLLDLCIGRMLELKQEIMEFFDLSDVSYLDNVLISLHLTPYDEEGGAPHYYARDRDEVLKARLEAMEEIDRKLAEPPPEPEPEPGETPEGDKPPEGDQPPEGEEKPEGEKSPEGEKPPEGETPKEGEKPAEGDTPAEGDAPPDAQMRKKRFNKKTEEEEEEEAAAAAAAAAAAEANREPTQEEIVAAIIVLIQRHERARQARVVAAEAGVIFRFKKRIAMGIRPRKIPPEELDAAATTIQRVWRGYSTRKKLIRREEKRKMLMGMLVPSWRSSAEMERVSRVYEHRRQVLEEHLEELRTLVRQDLQKYYRIQGPWLLDEYCVQMRNWFFEWYEKCKIFPEFPDEEDGGSMLLVTGQVVTPEGYLELQEQKRKEAEKSPKEKEKEKQDKLKAKQKAKLEKKKQKEKAKKEKERLKKLAEKGVPMKFKPQPSKVMPLMMEANEDFGANWRLKDESGNPLQRLDEELAYSKARPSVEARIRLFADTVMRIELQMLEEALVKDRKGKGRKKAKKKKKKKKKKRKGKKDMTKNRTTEELFEELYTQGVIRRYEPAKFSDFLGQYSANAAEMRQQGRDPAGGPRDVLRVIRDFCLLPMGSTTVHSLAPLTKSMCIMGPPQSGKKLLVRAICTSLGATMFDLSPANLAGKYEGKKSMKMLAHLIEKMSRILQPSILFFDGAEKMYYKRVPPAEKETDPKKLKKVLPKLAKGIKKEDLVMLVGTCSQPWLATARPMAKCYDKWALLPMNDYATVFGHWTSLLMSYHGVSRDIDLSGLARVTIGYQLPVIRMAVEQTLTVERILRLPYDPLDPMELYRKIQDVLPFKPEDQLKYLTFKLKNTALGKKRQKMLDRMAEEREKLEKIKQQEKAKKAKEKAKAAKAKAKAKGKT